MKRYWEHIKRLDSFSSVDIRVEWFSMKLSLILSVSFYLVYCINKYHSQPFPMGICQWLNCAIIHEQPVKSVVFSLLLIFSLLYVCELFMLFCTLGMFVLSVIVLSLDESNGNPAENGIISLLFFAQFLAYLFHKLNKESPFKYNRVQFSLQIVAAVYTVAGLSKLLASGMDWFNADAPKLALEVLRLFYAKYAATGLHQYSQKGIDGAEFIGNHLNITRFTLFISLLIELCSFIMLLGKKYSFTYACLLLAMHAGIYLVMGINLPTIMVPMLIVAVNPLNYLIIGTKSLLLNFRSDFSLVK